jgi:hypothetical protein
MKQQVYQAALAGGFESRLPQNPQNAGQVQNWTIDRKTGGWSTRVGYELYRPGQASYSPFGNVGAITSLHVARALAGGARDHILFEEDGTLHLLYESGVVPVLRTLATGRHIPAPTEAASWYTDTPHGTVITNGVDRPVLVRPWPLGNAAESATSIAEVIRPFGFDAPAAPVTPHKVKPYPPLDTTVVPAVYPAPSAGGAGRTTLWCPQQPNAIPDGGQYGLGFANNLSGDDGDKPALFGYAISYISDSGSEGPSSSLASVAWSLEADAYGFRHAVTLDIPTGPEGTVARKLYRTSNYAAGAADAGDTTLYFIDVIRNNIETTFFDATLTAALGQAAPDIPTGPLPAPGARFSALFNGCLFLDGGSDEPKTLFYSAPGLIEQFGADAYIELSSQGGGITALFGNYTTLLVFRENGIDVVQGDYTSGFTVTTISSSITCRAPHTVQAVPGLGVVFLATDGVYAITGGVVGGAVNDVVNLTTLQDSFIDRITPDCHPRAVAIFSEKSREYLLFAPVDGNDRPNEGFVLHVDRLAFIETLAPWSSRIGFPVGAVASLYDGTVIFGHNTGDESGDPSTQRGIFVMSGKRALGASIDGQDMVDGPAPTSVYRSAWFDAGDPQIQKQLSYVTLWLLTTGDAAVTMRHYKDFSLTPILERTYKAQPPDAPELATLDVATLGTSTYREARLVPLRYSVAQQSAAWFCFEIETTEDLVLVGFEYEYTTKGTRVVAGVRV